MRKIFAVVVLALSLTVHSALFAAEGSEDAEEKARQSHQLASTDMIYSQEELKAIYYENLEIIDLLKQIRDILDVRLKEPKTLQ